MQIANNCVVSLEYRLTDAAGELIDSSPASEPLQYLHGAAGILPLLEQALAGKSEGESFDVTITPERGFGERQPRLIEVRSRAVVTGQEQLTVGATVEMEDVSGGPNRSYRVVALDETSVTLDGNHPLAGRTLRFAGRVVGVRPATAEELGQH